MLDVVFAVRSDSFAGVERYICDVASAFHGRGWRVAVVGGDLALMTRHLPKDVPLLSATTLAQTGSALIRLGRACIVHAHMTAAEIAAVGTKPMTRARVVSTRHFAAPRGSRPASRYALGVLARGIDREVAISRFVALAAGADQTVVLNGVPCRGVSPHVGARQVLVMQRLEPEKDTQTAIRAWASSPLPAAGWRLLIAGRGAQRPHLEREVARLGVAESVTFTGFVTEPDKLMAASSIFLATSPAEPYGLTVVEAMAAGLPVVAADGGAHRETLGDVGAYFAPGDVEECVRELSALAASSDRRQERGSLGRERHARLLSLDAHVEGIAAVYRDVSVGVPA